MNIDWNLLVRFLVGVCSDEEREQFEQWLAKTPEHQVILRGARAMIAQARYEVPSDCAAELLTSLRHAISAAEPSGTGLPTLRVVRSDARPILALPLSGGRSRRSAWLKAVAAVLLLVGGGVVWAALSRELSAPKASTNSSSRDVITARGQRITFYLRDGSTVVLAPESRLRISHDYGVHARAVTLVGQGAFTVAHDTTMPFVVYTARSVIKDVSTQFVVREYENDAATEVVVSEGEVELYGRARNNGQGASLIQGQLGRLNRSGDLTVDSSVDVSRYWGWTKGRLIFRDTPLDEVAAQLARWYDVEIQLVPATLAHRHLDASIQDKSIDGVLKMVAASLGLDVETSGAERSYILRAR